MQIFRAAIVYLKLEKFSSHSVQKAVTFRLSVTSLMRKIFALPLSIWNSKNFHRTPSH